MMLYQHHPPPPRMIISLPSMLTWLLSYPTFPLTSRISNVPSKRHRQCQLSHCIQQALSQVKQSSLSYTCSRPLLRASRMGRTRCLHKKTILLYCKTHSIKSSPIISMLSLRQSLLLWPCCKMCMPSFSLHVMQPSAMQTRFVSWKQQTMNSKYSWQKRVERMVKSMLRRITLATDSRTSKLTAIAFVGKWSSCKLQWALMVLRPRHWSFTIQNSRTHFRKVWQD